MRYRSGKAKSIDKNWYFIDDINESYYSPFIREKRIYSYLGDGKESPSHKDIVEYFQKRDSSKIDIEYGKYFVERVHVPDKEPVTLPDGVYVYREGSYDGRFPERLVEFPLRDDKVVHFKSLFDPVRDDVQRFLNNKAIYDKHEMIYKLGLLMYGPPGSGKTQNTQKLIKEIIPKESIVLFFNSNLPELEFMAKLKETLSDRLKVFIFEELVAGLKEWDIEHLLNFLDGQYSMNNSIVIATTNYPELLPCNLSNRPSRFDKLYEFNKLTSEEAGSYIEMLLGKPPGESDLKQATELTIAAIKEACLVCLLRGITLTQSLKEQKARIKLCDRQFAKPQQVGLGFSNYD